MIDIDAFIVTPGSAPDLAGRDTAGKPPFDKVEGKRRLAQAVERIDASQQRLWAERRWAVLLILQGLDTSGKDGAIRHVLSGVNPQGVQVTSFVAPNGEERLHDFLWRIHKNLPQRGAIGVFNRSHYEDVVVPRLHPEVLDGQRLPRRLAGDDLIERRLDGIANFERYLARQGTAILKIFLHVSREEQRDRLLARLDDPAKQWKFDPSDVVAHKRYGDVLAAYEAAITATAAQHAPWYVIPADRKWYARAIVAEALARTLERLDPEPPRPDPAQEEILRKARAELTAEA